VAKWAFAHVVTVHHLLLSEVCCLNSRLPRSEERRAPVYVTRHDSPLLSRSV
jgi:hypothetical protein